MQPAGFCGIVRGAPTSVRDAPTLAAGSGIFSVVFQYWARLLLFAMVCIEAFRTG